ncbi:ATP synthase subunit 5, mitochondrial [Golovinomyces cichoracearum]|uniref:ATP synthase subunit 5, mitochondrial n=1 Tax=Golovinomyces cichoracearum TaxID=62708 RepID=A0A420J354_9PEZI|nr:ATP synthase subunit 5, mitochondrial [Golovinomyces cichoracearum]
MLSCRTLLSSRWMSSSRTFSVCGISRGFKERNYATASIIDSKPPVALHGLDGTYATALYTAAIKNQTLDRTAKAINELKILHQKDPKLSKILQAPSLSAGDKSAIIDELQKRIGDSGRGDTVRNFMKTLAEYNRLGLLQSVCEKFGKLISAARGEVEATVISATEATNNDINKPLDSKSLSRLETAVSKSSFIGEGRKLRIKNTVKLDIIGGLIVEIGDRTIDLSVSSRVAKMNKLITDTI